MPLLEQNIDLNFGLDQDLDVRLEAKVFSWGQDAASANAQPDFILAADCAYLEETFPSLVKSLQDLMGEKTVLWFCFKKRRKRDKDCIKLIGKIFEVRAVKGEWELQGVFLFEIKRRS